LAGKEDTLSIVYMGFGWKLDLEPTELLVYLAIADHVDDDGEGCYASYGKLVAKTNLGKRTVIRACHKLEEAGILLHQGTHPRYGTNVWNIDKDKLPFKKPARNGKATKDLVPVPGKRQKAAVPGATLTPEQCQSGTPPGATAAPPQCHGDTSAGATVAPKPSVEPLEEPSGNHPGGKRALPPALDARVNPAAKIRTLRERGDSGTGPDEVDEIRARDRPETALQTKIAQLTHSRYLSASQKSRLRDGVTAAWGDSKLPVTHPSPEDEWAAHPELFAEYVELCARRIREESSRPPSRDKLVQSVRNYARYNTGWLDFRKAAQEERRQAQQRAHPSAKQNQWYYDPSKPDWMQ